MQIYSSWIYFTADHNRADKHEHSNKFVMFLKNIYDSIFSVEWNFQCSSQHSFFTAVNGGFVPIVYIFYESCWQKYM